MKIFNVGFLKTNFSDIITKVKNGEEITVAYGKKKEKLAVIVPYYKYYRKNKKKLGLLKKATCKIKKDFKITEKEFLQS